MILNDVKLTKKELTQLFPGYENEILPEFRRKIEVFKRHGIDLVKVAHYAIEILNKEFKQNTLFTRAYLNCEENNLKSAVIGMVFQQIWIEALNILYSDFNFVYGGCDKTDIVCTKFPELNHELKTSTKLPIKRVQRVSGDKYVFTEDKTVTYTPAFSNHLHKTKKSKNSVKCPSESLFIHIKINPVCNINEDFRLNYVQGLIIKPGQLSKYGDVPADVLKNQSMILYEDTTYLLETYLKFADDYKNDKVFEYINTKKWNALTDDEKKNLYLLDKKLYEYACYHNWVKDYKNNQLSECTIELVNFIKIHNGCKGLYKYNSQLYSFMYWRTKKKSCYWTDADIKYIIENLGTSEEQIKKYKISLIK